MREFATLCKFGAFQPPEFPTTTLAKKKRTILVMHHVMSKNLRTGFAAMHRCVKSWQSQVAFARGPAAESSTLIPRYHKILILCICRMGFFFFFVQGSIIVAGHHITVLMQIENKADHDMTNPSMYTRR